MYRIYIYMVRELKLKYSKYQKGKYNFINYKEKKQNLQFGHIGIWTEEPGRLTKKHIEAFRKQLRRNLKKKVRLWIKIKPNILVTKKATSVRMGKGKGYDFHKVARVKAGQLIFEFIYKETPLWYLKIYIRAAISKLPLNCKFIIH